MGVESALSLLGPTRVRLDGSGGVGELTTAMVQAGLGALKDEDGAALLLAKVQGVTGYARLEHNIHRRVLAIAKREGWRPDKPRTLKELCLGMTRLALLEFLIPQKCSMCHGRAKRYVRAKRDYEPCRRCDGVGSLPLSARERARELGIAPTTWQRNWSPRYQRIQAFLSDLYGTAESDLRRALR